MKRDYYLNLSATDTASKGAVLAMTRELAMVHAREGIRINSLCPGPLKTRKRLPKRSFYRIPNFK